MQYEFVEGDLGDAHPNTVKIIMVDKIGNQSEIVGASIGGGSIKITKINGLDVEFTGEYPTLIIRQKDVHGVVANVTRIMNQIQINIAFMRVFRHKKGEDAFMIIETDETVPKEIIENINLIGEEIIQVYLIEAL